LYRLLVRFDMDLCCLDLQVRKLVTRSSFSCWEWMVIQRICWTI